MRAKRAIGFSLLSVVLRYASDIDRNTQSSKNTKQIK